MGQARQRALTNYFGLEENLADKIPDAFADGEEMEAGIFLRFEDFVEDDAESTPKSSGGCRDEHDEEQFLGEGEVLRFSQGCGNN